MHWQRSTTLWPLKTQGADDTAAHAGTVTRTEQTDNE
jgi:hypothetical protein